MNQNSLENYYKFLDILISKHNEQGASYYKRLTLYFTIITVIVVGISTIANQDGDEIYNEDVRKASLIVISLLGLFFSFIWLLIMRASNRWIRYWSVKISLFESHMIKKHDIEFWGMYMLDRNDEVVPNESSSQVFCSYLEKREKALNYQPKIHNLITIFISAMIVTFAFLVWSSILYF